ncbi:MAG TPA: SpaH/EbpB family LPXTG-anchored major pilin [Agrococcus sp.]|nr:SpaH/EbpB family LPXTG-anchored major pilin [Agrococcus sp.]
MATTKKSLTVRLAAGVGAVALATLTALGTALPASAAPNIDETATGSIVVHKLTQPVDGSQLTAGTGALLDSATLPAAINGVTFEIQRIGSFDVLDNDDWATAGSLDVDAVLADPTTYGLVPAGTQVTATHAEFGTGVAAFTGLPLGAYVVRELGLPTAADGEPNVVIPGAPFIVVIPQSADGAWLYDVHVYPKNAVAGATKSVEDFAHEGLGSAVTWTVRSTAPVPSAGTSLDSYAIQDDLDATLDFVEGSVAVSVGSTVLTEGAGFTLSAPAASGGSVVVTFDADGVAALRANPGAAVTVQLSTAVIGVTASGALHNTAVITVNGAAAGTSVAAAVGGTITSTTATDQWGSVVIRKHAADDADDALAGAVFEIHDANGTALAVLVDGTPQTQFTTGADGTVAIPGLRTDADGEAYTLVEVEAPAGYVLPADAETTVTVLPGSATAQVEIANQQVPAYALPVTGGSGQAAFMIGGAGLLLGALGFALLRRRKATAEV